MAAERGIRAGPVCVLSVLEPCPTFEYVKSKIVRRKRPCHVLYHYGWDERLGWMYARIQTWFPFQIQIGINGREWLAQQMRQAGLAFQQEKNCFSTRAGVDEPATANRLGGSAQRLRAAAEPHPRRGFRQLSNAKLRAPYYWTCYQSEWATDIVFKSGEQLKSLMPAHLSTDPEWMSPGTTVHQAEEGWAGTPVDRPRVDVAGNYRSPVEEGWAGAHRTRPAELPQ